MSLVYAEKSDESDGYYDSILQYCYLVILISKSNKIFGIRLLAFYSLHITNYFYILKLRKHIAKGTHPLDKETFLKQIICTINIIVKLLKHFQVL